jgi:hypothetical protein
MDAGYGGAREASRRNRFGKSQRCWVLYLAFAELSGGQIFKQVRIDMQMVNAIIVRRHVTRDHTEIGLDFSGHLHNDRFRRSKTLLIALTSFCA